MGERIHIALPPVEILDLKLDVERSEIYDIRKSIMLSPDAGRLHAQLQRQALKQARQDVLDSGLLVNAERQAKQQLQDLMATLGREVDISFRQ